MKKKLRNILIVIASALFLTGCSQIRSYFSDLKGSLIGNSFTIEAFDNYGHRTMTTSGDKINLKGNRVKEVFANDEGFVYSYDLSSVITIIIDGREMESCGDTLIFTEKGLEKDYDFTTPEFINSHSEVGDITDNTVLAYWLNQYKNKIGKKRAVVIKSQLGQPLCVYSGNKVYWEIPEDLPKMTKLMVDGKALYIHRANFQIIDKGLLKD